MEIRGKKAQVTIFIILAIVIVLGVGIYFLVKGNLTPNSLNKNLQPGYNSYLDCIKARAELGTKILGQQGGYIYINELPFYPGSPFMPSSSQLSFAGTSVPYWLYVSGNNILGDQKPTKERMQQELERFIYAGLSSCDFSLINSEGIFVDVYNGSVDVKISDYSVDIDVKNPVVISFENQSAKVDNHKVSIDSKLGKFYNMATKVLDKEKNESFLEQYGLDVLRLNAPVTGVELNCAPKVFNEAEIKQNVSIGLEETVDSLKLKGNYYTLSNPEESYYLVDIGQNVDEQVNFLYSSSWPTKLEMQGDKVVQPIGNQNGLGILGMCFVPYNFVYDISFPVLVQFYDNSEMFQFGMVALIDNNQAREALLTSNDTQNSLGQICANSNQNITVSTYDLNLKPVPAYVRFNCLTDSCDLGSTTLSGNGANLQAQVPQCVNGILEAYADGYTLADYQISTNTESSANIIMKKIHNVNVDLGNVGKASVLFSSPSYSDVVDYPMERNVSLVEGEYNVSVYVYKNTTINFPGVTDRKCLDVPSSSVGSLFGQTEQKCFDINIPAQNIDSALVGGGQSYYYFSDLDLSNAKKIAINVPLYATPANLDDLQANYIKWEDSELDVKIV